MTGLTKNCKTISIIWIILVGGYKAQLIENACPEDRQEELFLPHEYCNKFYQCSNGRLIIKECPENLVFNLETWTCDWAYAVDCCDRKLEKLHDENEDNENEGNDIADNNHSEAFDICAKNFSDGTLIVHEDCGKFYKCANGIPVSFKCYGTLLFNPETGECDWSENVNCNNQDSENEGDGDKDSDKENEDSKDDDNSDDKENNELSEASLICAKENSDGVLVAHENCQKFYKCANGVAVVFKCYGSLFYNPFTQECDWPQNVDCRNQNSDSDNKESKEEESEEKSSNETLSKEEDTEDNESANKGSEQEDSQDSGDQYSVEEDSGEERSRDIESEEEEDNNSNDYDDDNGGESENNNPNGPNIICAGNDSDGILIPHKKCNKFYKCANGIPFVFKCSGSLLYNHFTERCDWPEFVDCNGRENSYDDNKLKKKILREIAVGLSLDL